MLPSSLSPTIFPLLLLSLIPPLFLLFESRKFSLHFLPFKYLSSTTTSSLNQTPSFALFFSLLGSGVFRLDSFGSTYTSSPLLPPSPPPSRQQR
ncbi:hypothetical protein V8E36_002925, partial [Tilletia maclaganii]